MPKKEALPDGTKRVFVLVTERTKEKGKWKDSNRKYLSTKKKFKEIVDSVQKITK